MKFAEEAGSDGCDPARVICIFLSLQKLFVNTILCSYLERTRSRSSLLAAGRFHNATAIQLCLDLVRSLRATDADQYCRRQPGASAHPRASSWRRCYMRMKAAVLHELGLPVPYVESKPFVIEDVDLDGPGDDEVLVEIHAAGLCHSDLSIVAGLRKRTLPTVGGHEGAGVVREVGRGVKGLRPGDHVVMTVGAGCGHCRPCYDGRSGLCDEIVASRVQGVLPNGSRRLHLGDDPLFHFSSVSSFAQYAVTVPETLVKIDPAIPLDVAAMFGCAVVTGVGAVFNSAKVRPGQNVAIIGLGGVGFNAVMAARIAGASQIIGVDINEDKFELARGLGCTATLSARAPNLIEQIMDLTEGGVDFAFEVSGTKPGVASAIAMTRKAGEVVCVGLGSASELYEYNHASLVLKETVIRGSLMGGGVAARDIPQYLRLYQEGRLPVDRLKSGAIGFDGLNESLDLLHRGAVLRQILLPHG
ncbi:zinc-binding dehydrogenase [Sphingobium sp. H39-3-25]|uniref:zinc-binding dehydrogenase n=1 Tax=Sphingobium arseniciresistens TaxID=3030834 RepID=UPI0023B9D5A3|nr:zinc-binding dehydrogenase [Sphingobium arseniciresistens]